MVQIRNPLTVVQTGGGPTPPAPLDPEQVYRDTRPADWLVMPEIGANEDNVVYCLLMLDENAEADTYAYFSFGAGSSGTKTLEFGTTDSSGVFTPNSALTITTTGDDITQTLHPSDFGNLTSDGKIQLMCKLSASEPLSTIETGNASHIPSNKFKKTMREIKAKATQATVFQITSRSSQRDSANIRYFDLLGTSRISSCSQMFAYCSSLVAIIHLDTSSSTNFVAMFSSCGLLIATPSLDTSNGTSFSSMFHSCYSLTAIPQLDTSNGTDFSLMFYNCYSLTAIPQLDTSNGTSFSSMFYNCYSLTAIPQLDTSNGTNFSRMLSGCRLLTTIPQLNTSNGANFSEMFGSCSSLTAIPQLNTSSGTNFSAMFSTCSSLTAIPQLNTSNGTNFQNMFNSCSSLTAIPQLNTSNGTNFQNMFGTCYSLNTTDFTGYDFSAITTTNALNNLLSNTGAKFIEFGDTFGTNGILNTSSIMSFDYAFASSDYRVHIKINKTDAMLPIAANATTIFSNTQYYYVYVPDALLSTYQADTYWATLGARLKGFSELPS